MVARQLVLIAAGCLASASAHDIPNDVTVQALLKPEGHRLMLLVRVPMAALRNTTPEAAPLELAAAVELYEEDSLLPKPRVVATQISLPSDKSFASWEQALAHVTGPPLPVSTSIFENQAMRDILFDYPIRSDRAHFSIDPGGLAYLGLRTLTVLRFIPPDGPVRAFEYEGNPGLVRLDPRWYQAAKGFVRMGFLHILDGTDHLLFVFCLVVPFRRLRALIPVITAFTVAHSITLIASAYDYAPNVLWFPPLIEVLIAVSIFYMALENIVVASEERRVNSGRWALAFGFGLIHGFGFSFALRQNLQFAGSYLLTSLLSFNIGVELGQLLVLVLLIPALNLLYRYVMKEKTGVVILSAIAADIAGHWIVERWNHLSALRIAMPEWDAVLLLSIVRWAIAFVIVAGLWLLGRKSVRRKLVGRAL